MAHQSTFVVAVSNPISDIFFPPTCAWGRSVPPTPTNILRATQREAAESTNQLLRLGIDAHFSFFSQLLPGGGRSPPTPTNSVWATQCETAADNGCNYPNTGRWETDKKRNRRTMRIKPNTARYRFKYAVRVHRAIAACVFRYFHRPPSHQNTISDIGDTKNNLLNMSL